jgi:hypothetical protein
MTNGNGLGNITDTVTNTLSNTAKAATTSNTLPLLLGGLAVFAVAILLILIVNKFKR